MNSNYGFRNGSFKNKQKGIATILIVVLVGMALTATALGIVHSVRSAQEKHVSTHAATNAQNSLWAGVEAFRRYLGQIDTTTFNGLSNSTTYNIDMGAGYGNISAQNITITTVGSVKRVSADIISRLDAARASTAARVIYEVTPGVGSNYQLSSVLNFNDDLRLTSKLTFDAATTINVKGNVNIANANVTNLGGVNATGNVVISSNGAVGLGNIHANGNVTLGGTSPVAGDIRAQGNVTLTDTAGASTISANGNVSHNASTNTNSLRSRANITIGKDSGSHNLINAAGTVNLIAAYTGTVTNLWSVGNIVNASTDATITNSYGQGNFDCPALWGQFTHIAINGNFGVGCTRPLTPTAGQTVVRPGGVTVNVMNPVPAFGMPSLAVDVFPYRDEANYVVEYVSGKIKVSVYNINGLTNGAYYLGQLPNGNKSAICPAVDSSGKCTCPAGQPGCTLPTKYLCLGYAEAESCISYATGKFTLAGSGIAPGIWWVDGNVEVSNGFNNATLFVTGNITSSNHYRGSAVNYGGEPVVYSSTVRDPTKRTTPYQEICQAIGTGLKAEMSHMVSAYKTRFENQYPTNLCNKTTSVYTPHRLGNIALAAGGTRPVALGGDGTTFSGGDIDIKANSNVFGIVLAGGYFAAKDNTAIMGYVSASVQGAQRTTGTEKNLFNGDVKIYTNSATEFYSPSIVPWMGASPCTVGCGSGAVNPNSKLLWSKYL